MNTQTHTASTFTAPIVCAAQGLMGDARLLSAGELTRARARTPRWEVLEGRRLQRLYRFGSFAAAQAFVRHVEALSAQHGQLPQIFVSFDQVRVELWTQALGGLTQADFDLAEQLDGAETLP